MLPSWKQSCASQLGTLLQAFASFCASRCIEDDTPGPLSIADAVGKHLSSLGIGNSFIKTRAQIGASHLGGMEGATICAEVYCPAEVAKSKGWFTDSFLCVSIDDLPRSIVKHEALGAATQTFLGAVFWAQPVGPAVEAEDAETLDTEEAAALEAKETEEQPEPATHDADTIPAAIPSASSSSCQAPFRQDCMWKCVPLTTQDIHDHEP